MSVSSNGRRFSEHHLHPSIIQDVSTDTPGIVAAELAAELGVEEEGLLNTDATKRHSYGAILADIPDQDYDIDDPNSGYALPKAQLYTVISSFIFGFILGSIGWYSGYNFINHDSFQILYAVSNISSDLQSHIYLSSAAFPTYFLGKLV
ncbi:predicted protein [Candida tropicalis MYA-3404]|uniref:Uncharacterized protein n=1 Tax=Candida tropicalis (strain ATCC MYA-3404 / T1) TaxID=294747 RepID=C5M2P2_CANTT|nr:predicted protein [Candida tropicalis MYA-3404]EER35592.1 predicted protein [Candida tropicalis MYA-3404]